MNFFSLVASFGVALSLNFGFAQSTPYQSISYAEGLQIFANAFGLSMLPGTRDLKGKLNFKNCKVEYGFNHNTQLFDLKVIENMLGRKFEFWSHFRSGNLYVGALQGSPVLPLFQSNKMAGFVALNRVGIDCETQGCWREELIRVIVKPGLLTVQSSTEELNSSLRPSVKRIDCKM